MHPVDLRTNYLVDPVAVDAPVFATWRLEGPAAPAAAGFEVRVCDAADGPDAPLWSSGLRPITGDVGIELHPTSLPGGRRLAWTIRLITTDGEWGAWATPARFALLPSDLTHSVRWVSVGPEIEPPRQRPVDGSDPEELGAGLGDLVPVTVFRRRFHLAAPPPGAVLYATALGVYRLAVNGRTVGMQHLAPGWTDYDQRVQVQAYEVGPLLLAGENMIEVSVGAGWYAGYVGFDPRRRGALYGYTPRFLARLDVDDSSGLKPVVVTDQRWECSRGRTRWADLQKGERWNLRRGRGGTWGSSGVWSPVRTHTVRHRLVAQRDLGIGTHEVLPLSRAHRTASGEWILDAGQNVTGWTRLSIGAAPAGTEVVIRHAEALRNGELYRENLRTADQVDGLITDGLPIVFEPEHTIHGFRYVGISGLDSLAAIEDAHAVVAHAAAPRTGWFTCSDPTLQRVYDAVVWTVRNNLQSVPSDCPQRDERLGWLGDAGTAAPFVATTFDASTFYRKWLRDILDAQDEDGMFPDVAPSVGFVSGGAGAPGYADTGVTLPALLLRLYGDLPSVREAYPHGRRFINRLMADSDEGVRVRGLNRAYGDWLELGPQTPPELVATAFSARSARAMSRMATALGRRAAARRYERFAARVADAFARQYARDDGRVGNDSISSYAFALGWDLLPSTARARAIARMLERIGDAGGHVTTGILGTAVAWELLGRDVDAQIAYAAAQSREYPSLGYMLDNGATTIWERWNSWTREDGFYTPEMNSLNHVALGTMAEWLYRYVAGIRVASNAVGWNEVEIGPAIGGGLSSASARIDTVRGRVESAWERDGGRVTLQFAIPHGVRARIVVPAPAGSVRRSGTAARGAVLEERSRTTLTVEPGPGEVEWRHEGIHA